MALEGALCVQARGRHTFKDEDFYDEETNSLSSPVCKKSNKSHIVVMVARAISY